MPTLYDSVREFAAPYSTIILVLVIFVIFILVAIYAYQYVYLPKQKTIMSSTGPAAGGGGGGQPLAIYFFYVDWCPHCKVAMPQWKQFVEDHDGKFSNGYTVSCHTINATEDDDPKVANLVKKFKIDSYPTIKMTKNSETIDFDAKVSKYTLEQFLQTTTQR